MNTYNGRPENPEGRLPRELRTYDFLDRLGIPYTRVDHEAANTMEACGAIDQALGTQMCKNLFLCNRQKTAFYLLLMPGDKKFRTKDLSAQIQSSRLSFAGEADMLALLDIQPGAVSVMGLMNDREHRVTLLADQELLEEEYLGCHPCVNTSSLRLKQEDLWKRFLPATGHNLWTVSLPREEGGAE